MDFRDVIDLWPTRADLADAIGVKEKAVHQWALRNDIPSDHYRRIVRAARRLIDAGKDPSGVAAKITYDLLFDLGEAAKREREGDLLRRAPAQKRKAAKGRRSRAELARCA